MRHFWRERYIGSSCLYFGLLGDFRIGIVLGRESFVYLGFICFGIDNY